MIAEPRHVIPLEVAVRLRLACQREADQHGYISAPLLTATTRALNELSAPALALYHELFQPRGQA